MDYRGTFKTFQYDPTKWFICLWEKLGWAHGLQRFSANEIRKGRLAMETKQLLNFQNSLDWGKKREDLPVITWEECKSSIFFLSTNVRSHSVWLREDKKESKDRPLVLVAGYVHDVSSMIESHPGGPELLREAIGNDATVPFFGGVYDHPISAKNVSLTHFDLFLSLPSDCRPLFLLYHHALEL